jgi:hypothetical protein
MGVILVDLTDIKCEYIKSTPSEKRLVSFNLHKLNRSICAGLEDLLLTECQQFSSK